MSNPNPLRKYLSKEDLLQEDCFAKHSIKYPGIPLIHCANEGQRTPFEQVKFNALGGESGVSDLLHPASSGNHKGIWIELKCGKNKLSPKQLEFLVKMHYLDYATAVVYDRSDDFLFLLQSYYDDPTFFNQGIILCRGELKAFKYEEAAKTLVAQKREIKPKTAFKEKIKKAQKSKFGQPLKINKEKLPNQGKLFQSPKKQKDTY